MHERVINSDVFNVKQTRRWTVLMLGIHHLLPSFCLPETFWPYVSVADADVCHDGRRDQLPGQLHETLHGQTPSLPRADVLHLHLVRPACADSAHEPASELYNKLLLHVAH